MTHTTTTTKNRYGDWKAYSTAVLMPMGEGYREISLETHKGRQGNLTSSVHVASIRNGMKTFAVYGDFAKNIVNTPCARVTEKALIAAHSAALAHFDDAIAEARAFYADKEKSKYAVA